VFNNFGCWFIPATGAGPPRGTSPPPPHVSGTSPPPGAGHVHRGRRQLGAPNSPLGDWSVARRCAYGAEHVPRRAQTLSPPRSGPTGNTSLARRLPGFDARHATRRARRVRALVVSGAIVLLAAAATVFVVKDLGGPARSTNGAANERPTTSGSPRRGATSSSRAEAATPTVTVALASSQLAAPVDGEVVLPGSNTQLVVMGGATTGGSLASGIFVFDTSTGKLVHVGNLTMALEDACGAVVTGQDLVLGGSSRAALSTVQGLSASGALATAGGAPSSTGSLATATVLGALPQARSDAGVATIGTTTYLVGGDDGTNTVPQVLATNDGRTFVTVASLAQPVRFGAVAELGKKLYVFGGQSMSQSGTSPPLDTIQVVDPISHRARIVGHLPEPLSEASAVTIGSHVLVIGGITVEHGPGSAPSATGSATSSAGGYSTTTVPDIWSFDATTAKVRRVAQLPEPVARAGVAVAGSVAWVVGGESSGVPVSSVQVITVQTASRR